MVGSLRPVTMHSFQIQSRQTSAQSQFVGSVALMGQAGGRANKSAICFHRILQYFVNDYWNHIVNWRDSCYNKLYKAPEKGMAITIRYHKL